MDFKLTEEQRSLVALLRDFCKRETSPQLFEEILRKEQKERIPWDLVKKMHDLGLTTLVVPTKYGGSGVTSLVTQVLLSECIGQYAAPLSSFLWVHWKLCLDIAALGTQEKQDEIFTRIMNDHTFQIGTTMTEPDHGHDPRLPYDEPGSGMSTFAYRDGDEYVINGEKCFCGGAFRDLLVVYVRTDKNKPLSQSMSVLLVPTNTPGFSVQRTNDSLSTGIWINGDLLFDNVRVPVYNLLGKENKGFDIYKGRRGFWLGYTAFQIGLAQAAYELTKEYAKTRIQGGKPIFEHLTIGTRIVDMLLKIEQARLLVYKTAWEYDQGGNVLVDPLGFCLCVAAIHDLKVAVALHAAEVFAGRAGLAEMPIYKYIHGAIGDLHSYETGTMNRIMAMSMV